VTSERRAVLLMLAFVALWMFVETLAASVLRTYSPYQVVWTRYGVHLLLMFALWGWREPATLWTTRRPLYQLARSMLMLGMPAFWITGMQPGNGRGAVMAFFWVTPLLILVLARIFLRESIDRWLWAAGAAASVGAILAHGESRLPPLASLVFPLGMALCFSAYVVMTRPLARERMRTNLFYTALGVFLALTPAMPALWVTPTVHDLAVLVAVGLFGYLVLLTLDRMAAAAPVSLTAPMASTFVGFSVPIGLLLGHQQPGRGVLLGLLLIGAVALYIWSRTARRTTPIALSEAA